VLEISYLARSPVPLPQATATSFHRDAPDALRHLCAGHGTAGRLRSGDDVAILADLGRHGSQRRDVCQGTVLNPAQLPPWEITCSIRRSGTIQISAARV